MATACAFHPLNFAKTVRLRLAAVKPLLEVRAGVQSASFHVLICLLITSFYLIMLCKYLYRRVTSLPQVQIFLIIKIDMNMT